MLRSAAALIVLLHVLGCGGDDDGGGGGADGGGGGADADPDQPDGGGAGWADEAAGQFVVDEMAFGGDGTAYGSVFGSIVDPRPAFHMLAMEAGSCRSYTYAPGNCEACAGICDANDECVPFPASLSAGEVTITGTSETIAMSASEYGYQPSDGVPQDLFDTGDGVELSAAGAADVAAFSLAAHGVAPIEIDLEVGEEGGGPDALRMTDGGDLVLTWAEPDPAARVRLEINSDNQGHGLPVSMKIVCQGDDDGSLTVPRALVEAFPAKPYEPICVAHDCPVSTLTRQTADRTAVGGRDMELVVGFQRQFLVIHE